jgi:hypothetical protein
MPVVRRKLHASLDPADTDQRNIDALDLVSDIRVTVLAEFTRDSPAGDGGAIRDLNSFTAAVASNACYQYLRAKFPIRTQQRNRLRYVLTHKDGYSMWTSGAGQVLCGLKVWERANVSPVPLGETVRLPEPHSPQRGDDPRTYLAAVECVLTRVRGPVLFDELVENLMVTFGLTEQIEVQCGTDVGSFDIEGSVPDLTPLPDQQLEGLDELGELWRKIKVQLSLNQRIALLLNLRGPASEGLINVLPMSRVASVREIAGVLGFEAEEFAGVWASLPWDDRRIAEHLGITRQQVINLRQSARAKLAKNLDRRRAGK